jgi:hypothetical protein
LCGITEIKKRDKVGTLNIEEEEALIQYVKKMQGIGHPITFTK